jgi:catechol 2,3-dioxygenase-like lactoylglutathione lyase family enzyme
MIDHFSIQCADVGASARFYDAVLASLGGERVADFGDVIGYGTAPKAEFWIGPRRTGEGFRESHIAFAAVNPMGVDAFLEAARSVGADVLYPAQEWPEYHEGYYGAFVRDPDGNNVEAVSHATP